MKRIYKGLITLLFISMYAVSFAQQERTITSEVAGNCAICKQRIEKAAKINGVSQTKWNMQDGLATVVFNPDITSDANIKQASADAWHDNAEVRAELEVYENLHECCLYDRLGEEKA